MNLVSILILALIAVGFFAAVKYSRKKGCSCGQHSCRGCTLKCRMPSSRSALEESAAAAYSADTSTESRKRTQPKSQTEKQIDELRKQLSQSGGTAEKLVSPTQTSYATVQDGQGLCMFQNGEWWAFLQRASNGFMLSGTNASHLTISSDYPKQLVELSSGSNMIILNNHDEKGITIEVDNTTRLWVYQRGKFYLRPSGLSFVNSKNITYRFEATNEGWAIYSTTDDTGRKLEAKSDGLYFNGKKVLLEG